MLERLTFAMCCLLVACARRDVPAEPAVPSASAGSAAAPPTVTASSAGPAPSVGGWGWAVSADGHVRILGLGKDAVHNHGGPPAYIGSAAFQIRNERATPLRISVDDIEWLIGSGCPPPLEVKALEIKAHPLFAELRRGSSDLYPSQSLTVPAKSKLDLEVGYAPQEAYMVSCNRFATRVYFNIEGERVGAIAEHRVTRRSPLKRP